MARFHREAVAPAVAPAVNDRLDAIAARAAAGDREAEARLCESLAPWVARIARSIYAGRDKARLDDLTQAGLLGLVLAARRFDRTRGVRFRTFAAATVRGLILTTLRRDSRHGLTYAPDPLPAPVTHLSEIRRADAEGEPLGLSEIVPTPGRDATEHPDFDSLDLPALFVEAPPRWQEAVVRHAGWGDTLDAVGRRLGVTRERVRQMVQRGLCRARQAGERILARRAVVC